MTDGIPMTGFATRIPRRDRDVLRVLLLEDRPSDADLLMIQFLRLEWKTEVRHVTGKDGFEEAFINFEPHIVVSDFMLPDYTGIDALSYVRERDDHLPFIICTGRVNEETAVACLKAGADDYLLKDDLGRVTSAMENALLTKTTQVEKNQAIENLELSEANFRVLSENAPDHIFRVDRKGVIAYVNRSFHRQSPQELLGDRIQELFQERNGDRFMLELGICWNQGIPRTFEMGDYDGEHIRNWYYCRMGPMLQEGRTDSIIFIVSDITEKKITELELERTNTRLHQLSQHLETIRDEEKKRISMEIHDQLGQELTAAKLGLYWVQKSIQDMGERWDGEAVLTKLQDLIELNTTTIKTVRRIAHELRPVVLDNIGLIPALEWHIDMHNQNHETQVSLMVDVDPAVFNKELSTAIYRIVQEALTNINRHAQAAEAWVELRLEDEALWLEIRDNGVGIDMERAKKSKSLGLFGIQERLKTWHGELDISGQPGAGTTIRIRIPESQLTPQNHDQAPAV